MARCSVRVGALVAALMLGSAGCGALYPEMSTTFSPAPKNITLDPPPPVDRHYVKVVGGVVPPKTRDGRSWDQVFGSLPDPVAKVIVNNVELFTTNADSDTLEPKWADSPSGNYAIQVGDKVEVQLWDSNTFNSTPIGTRTLTLTPDLMQAGEVLFELSGGGTVTLQIGPARAIWGCGFWYELRNDSAYVTRLIDGSPATRLGMKEGDRILQIDKKPVDKMSLDEVRSALGSIPVGGRALGLQHSEGGTLQVTLKEGPIYPLLADYPKLPVVP